MAIFARCEGLANRLFLVGDQLEGGIMLETAEVSTIKLQPCTLHAVFTTSRGFLVGINYFKSELVGRMSKMLIHRFHQFHEFPDSTKSIPDTVVTYI